MLIRSISPLTGKVIGKYPSSSSDDVNNIVIKAKNAQNKLSELSQDYLITCLYQLKQIIKNSRQQITRQISDEIGKSTKDAEYEIFDILQGIEYYLQRKNELLKLAQPQMMSDSIIQSRLSIIHKIKGIIGLITPWNFPFWMPMTTIIPALLTGSPIILKPSEYSTGTGLLIEHIINKAKFPPFTIQVLIGTGYVGEKLVNHPDVNHISFIGSTPIGQSIARSRVIGKNNSFTLEMGGNSAAIIMPDTDIDLAVNAVFWNGVYYAGQVCTGVKRVLIHQSVYELFKQKVLKLADKYNQPELLIQKIGAIIKPEIINMFEYRINTAIKSGNKLLCGGKRIIKKQLPKKYASGNFFPITVLEISNRNVDLIQQETFGPFLPLIKFEDVKQAVDIANETDYGLSCNIFTNNQHTLDYLTKNITAGMFFVNDSEVAYPGGNFWKGAGQSYLSTTSDDKLLSMFNNFYVWQKKSRQPREYWFK